MNLLLVLYDLETTDCKPTTARILQLAASSTLLRYDEAEKCYHACERSVFESDAQPPRPFSVAPGARRAHGMSDARIARAPAVALVLRRYAAWLHARCTDASGVLMVGHNAHNFDMPLLFCELERCGVHPLALVPARVELFFGDTLAAWRRDPPLFHAPDGAHYVPAAHKQGFSLLSLHRQALCANIERAHSALGDVEALERLLLAPRSDGLLRSPQALARVLEQALQAGEAVEKFEARRDRAANVERRRLQCVEPYERLYELPHLARRTGQVLVRLSSLRCADARADAPAPAVAPTASPYFATRPVHS